MDLTVQLIFERRLYEALIMSMSEDNLNMEFKTAIWNLKIFQVTFTFENKIQGTRGSPRKDGPFAWFHMIRFHQHYHPDCCNNTHHQDIFQRHLHQSKACGEQIRTSEKIPIFLRKTCNTGCSGYRIFV